MRSLPPVTKNLLIINVIIWLALQFFPASTKETFMNICALHYFTSDNFNPAQLVTYMFVQENFFHLFFNMFALYMFGNIIERVVSPKRFLFYYLSCGIGAALIQLGVFAIMISNAAGHLPDGVTVTDIANCHFVNGQIISNPKEILIYRLISFSPDAAAIYSLINTEVIGASGAVFGILLAFGYMFPKAPLYLFFIPVPIQARWIVIGYGAIELLQSFNDNPGDNVAHVAHLGGMLIGFAILLYWKKKGLFNNGSIY